jgi:alkanesulfonate monooxygenase SsuD/methylene tetrahydromethanopterin reductase-like flavin-dependent oxidoreductase (luciferase family)
MPWRSKIHRKPAPAMKFGVFDHLDSSGAPLASFYEDRLRLAQAYERAGIHAYHIAEHHHTPLGLSPSPSVFLAALAQRTTHLRFGPVVYTLPLYHPLRLVDEICMLDQMSGGRLELGIGRGVSPMEFGLFGFDIAQSQPMYFEAYQVLMQALTSKSVTFEGKYYRFRNVPILLEPLQKPHPPLWYGLSKIEAVEWAAANAINVVSNQPAASVRVATDRYRAEWTRLGKDPARLPFLGFTRHVVIAPSEREALAIARRGYARWYASFIKLWREAGDEPPWLPYPEDFDEILKRGQLVAGTPATVRTALEAQIAEAGINYPLMRFAFGDLTLEESLRSVELFAREVMASL